MNLNRDDYVSSKTNKRPRDHSSAPSTPSIPSTSSTPSITSTSSTPSIPSTSSTPSPPSRDQQDEQESLDESCLNSFSSNSSTHSIATPDATVRRATNDKRAKKNKKGYNKDEVAKRVFMFWLDLNQDPWPRFLMKRTLKDLLKASADIPDEVKLPTCDEFQKIFHQQVENLEKEYKEAVYLPVMHFKAVASGDCLSCVALSITNKQRFLHVASDRCRFNNRALTMSVGTLRTYIDILNARLAVNELNPESILSVIIESSLGFNEKMENIWHVDVIWHPIKVLDMMIELDVPCTNRSHVSQIDDICKTLKDLKDKFSKDTYFYLSDFTEEWLGLAKQLENTNGPFTDVYLEIINKFLSPAVLASNVLDSSYVGAKFMFDNLESNSQEPDFQMARQLRERVLEFFRLKLGNEWDFFMDYFNKKGIFKNSFENNLSNDAKSFWTFNFECPKLNKLALGLARIPILRELPQYEILEDVTLNIGNDNQSDLLTIFKQCRIDQITSLNQFH